MGGPISSRKLSFARGSKRRIPAALRKSVSAISARSARKLAALLEKALPLEQVWQKLMLLLMLNVGFGFTVTVASTKLPLQLFADGVILYTTVPGVMPSVLLSNWLIAVPIPTTAPVTFVLLWTIQL